MHTELYARDHEKASVALVRATHAAWLQLTALGMEIEIDGTVYDNRPAIMACAEALAEAGHPGFKSKNA